MSILDRIIVTFVYEDRWRFFVDGLGMTLLLTVASFLLGTLLGGLFCLCKLSRYGWLRRIVGALTGLLIQLPTLVLLMLFVYIIFGSAPLSIAIVVIFGLTLKAAAYLCDIFHTAVTTVADGEIEAAHTLGLTRFQTFRYIILPQSIATALPVYKNQFVLTLQETSIVGYLAIMDLTRASEIVTSRTLDALFGLITISIIYLLIGLAGNRLLGLLGHTKHLGGDDK